MINFLGGAPASLARPAFANATARQEFGGGGKAHLRLSASDGQARAGKNFYPEGERISLRGKIFSKESPVCAKASDGQGNGATNFYLRHKHAYLGHQSQKIMQ